jgi:hypothetical protein
MSKKHAPFALARFALSNSLGLEASSHCAAGCVHSSPQRPAAERLVEEVERLNEQLHVEYVRRKRCEVSLGCLRRWRRRVQSGCYPVMTRSTLAWLWQMELERAQRAAHKAVAAAWLKAAGGGDGLTTVAAASHQPETSEETTVHLHEKLAAVLTRERRLHTRNVELEAQLAASHQVEQRVPSSGADGERVAVAAQLQLAVELAGARVDAAAAMEAAAAATAVGVTLRARWVTLRARWVTLRDRWVSLRARWE